MQSPKLLKGMVDLDGFEPSTSSMPWKRAPNCATGPFLRQTGKPRIEKTRPWRDTPRESHALRKRSRATGP